MIGRIRFEDAAEQLQKRDPGFVPQAKRSRVFAMKAGFSQARQEFIDFDNRINGIREEFLTHRNKPFTIIKLMAFELPLNVFIGGPDAVVSATARAIQALVGLVLPVLVLTKPKPRPENTVEYEDVVTPHNTPQGSHRAEDSDSEDEEEELGRRPVYGDGYESDSSSDSESSSESSSEQSKGRTRATVGRKGNPPPPSINGPVDLRKRLELTASEANLLKAQLGPVYEEEGSSLSGSSIGEAVNMSDDEDELST